MDLERQTTATPLTDEQFTDWQQIALSEYPKEACAFLVNDKVVQVPNASRTPLETFAVDHSVRLNLMSQGHISGFLHTHVTDPAVHTYPAFWASSHDMKSWLSDNIRWGISATDGEVVTRPVWLDEDYTAPLNGRFFIHGVHDCYGAVRDWFKVHRGVVLKNYPRGMEWWLAGQNLYEEQFKDAGFVEISSRDVKPGDCALFSIHSRGVISHAAVITGVNTMYHHTFSRTGESLSGEVEIGRWSKHIIKFVRFVGRC